MKRSVYGITILAMCGLAACHSSASKDSLTGLSQEISSSKYKAQDVGSDAASADSTTSAIALPDTSTSVNTVLQAGTPAYTDWDKKIIKNANISLEVKDFAAFTGNMRTRIKSFGAYTAGEQQTQSDTRIENNLTIKVPVDQFDNLVNSIGGDGITLLSKEISTDDVSGEVVDTKARMEAKKQLRDKYSELLKEARTMKDILQVQGEINNIQEDLDAAAGRVSYLTHSAAYSTVTLHYYQYLEGASGDSEKPGFLTNLKEAFATGGTIFLNVLLFLVTIWPLVLAGTIFYVAIKKVKAKKASV